MPTKQNIVGNQNEKDILKMLRNNGYWAYRTPNVFGQPIDLIFGKNDSMWLADAKNVESSISFPFSRIEPNQLASLSYAKSCGMTKLGFVLNFKTVNEFYWLSFDTAYEKINKDEKSIKYTELEKFEDIIK